MATSRDRNLRYNLSAETAQLERGISRAQSAMEGYERSIEDAWNSVARLEEEQAREAERQAQRRSEAWQSAGRGMAVAGAAMATALGLATRAAVQWESDWADVTKVLDGTPEELDRIEGRFRRLASSLPATHTEIAQVGASAAQLGVEAEHLTSFTNAAVQLGVTTNLSAEDASRGLARLSTVMDVSLDEIQSLGSSLVALGNNFATTEDEVLQMSLRLAGVGQQIGLTSGDVMGLAASMSAVGIRAEMGGGAFSRALQEIQQAAQAGGSEVEGFAEVAGLSASEFATAFEQRPQEAIVSFLEGLDRINERGGSVSGTLDDLGLSGTEIADVLGRTSASWEQVAEAMDVGNDGFEDANALVEEANARFETTEARMRIARSTLNDFAISVGETLLPALGDAADTTSAWATMWQELPDPVRETATVVGAAGAAATLAGGAFLIGAPKVAEFKTSLQDLGPRAQAAGRGLGRVTSILSGPWGLALAGGVAVLAAFAQQKAEATQKILEYVDAIELDSGAIEENTRLTAVKELEDQGVLQTAERLGVSLEDVTAAVLGENDAKERVNEATEEHLGQLNEERLANELSRGAYSDRQAEVRGLQNAIEGENDAIQTAVERTERETDAMGESVGPTQDAAGAIGEVESAARGAAGQTSELRDQLDQLTGAEVNHTEIEGEFHDALRRTEEAIRDTGGELDVTTEDGKELFDEISRLRDGTYDYIDSMKAQGLESDEIMDRYRSMRGDLIDLMVQTGDTREEAEDYVDELLGTPEEIATRIDVDARGQWTLHDLQGDASGSVGSFPGGAAGGAVSGPGTETSDSIPAWLSTGEHVLTAAEVRQAGGQQSVHAMRDLIRRGDLKFARGGAVARFANGGEVGAPQVIRDHTEDTRVKLQEMIVGLHGSIADRVGEELARIREAGGRVVGATTRWAGTPYAWGGGSIHGPSRGFGRGLPFVGFDCSSLVQHGWYQGTGGRVHLPRTTMDQISAGRGVSRAEAMPGDLLFPHRGHVGMYTGGGRMFHTFATGSVAQHAPAYASPIAVRRPARLFDRGGVWGHGEGGVNMSGGDERVLTPRQTEQFDRFVDALTSRPGAESGGGGDTHYHVHHVPGYSTERDLQRVEQRRSRRQRVGRAE